MAIPKNHPVVYASPLWAYLHDIERMLKARKTWREIAESLMEKGIVVHRATCCNFYHRYLRRKAKRKPVPLKLQYVLQPVEKTRRLTIKPQTSELPQLEGVL